jgi:hypothetical protein
MHKIAYGTDKVHDAENDDVYPPDAPPAELATLRHRVALLEERVPPKELDILRADLDALEAKFARPEAR